MATPTPEAGIPAVTGAVTGQAGTQQAGTTGSSLTITTPTDFAVALLSALGAPNTPTNVQALVAWMAKEGGNWHNTASFNPLNTTLQMPGSHVMSGGNTAGVQAFTSWQQGLDATVQTLQGYPEILAALHAGTDAQAVEQAVAGSPWGTGSFDLAAAGSYGNVTGGPGPGSVNPGAPGTYAAGAGAAAPAYDPNNPGGYPITPAVEQWIKQNAAQDAWMLSNPELAPILGYIAKYAVDPTSQVGVDTIQSLVSQTNWYKTHSQAQRNWTQLYASDPQEAARDIQQAKADIVAQSGSMGVVLTQDQLNTLAINKNFYAWDSQELQYAISSYLPSNKAPTAGGAAQVNFQSMKATATQTWGVPTSDAQIAQWTAQIAAGTQTVEGVTALLKQQATSLYPTLADQFNRGFTFADATDPYKQIAQQYLGTPADQINFTDPKWMAAVNQVDPKTGQRTEMGLDQWTNYIRSNPAYGYQNTTQAKNEMVGLSNAAAKTLGAIA